MPHLILAGMSPELQDGWEFFGNKEHRGENTTLQATAIPQNNSWWPRVQLRYTTRLHNQDYNPYPGMSRVLRTGIIVRSYIHRAVKIVLTFKWAN